MAISIQAQLKKVLTPFAQAVGIDIKKLQDTKQDKLKAGANIHIDADGTISSTGAGQAADLSAYSTTEQVKTLVDGKLADYETTAGLTTKLTDYETTANLTTKLADYAKTAEVQAKLTAGTGVTISEAGVISATAADLTGYVKEEALELGELNLVAEYEAGKAGTVTTPAAPAAASEASTPAAPVAPTEGTPAATPSPAVPPVSPTPGA